MAPMPSVEPKPRSTLAKLAALFATIFIVSLGICGYSIHTGDEFGGTPGFLSFIGIIVSLIGLFAVGVTAIFRLVSDKYYK